MDENIKKEDLDYYDIVLNNLVVNIYSLSIDAQKIKIGYLNWKNKIHKLFLSQCINTQLITSFPIEINCSLLDYFRIKKIYKNNKIKRVKNCGGMNISEIVNFMSKDLNKPIELFEDIYSVYYD